MIDDHGRARLEIMNALHRGVANDLKLRDSQMHEAIMMANLVELFAPDVIATINLMAAEITPKSVKLAAAIILLKRAEILARETFNRPG